MQPVSYLGLDLDPAGIDFCRQRHPLEGLSFTQGNAQQLPFADATFDVVVNVEASHGYPGFPGFLSEVDRVLRDAEEFLYADHGSGRDFAGVPGTRIYDALASGELAYRSWHFRKR